MASHSLQYCVNFIISLIKMYGSSWCWSRAKHPRLRVGRLCQGGVRNSSHPGVRALARLGRRPRRKVMKIVPMRAVSATSEGSARHGSGLCHGMASSDAADSGNARRFRRQVSCGRMAAGDATVSHERSSLTMWAPFPFALPRPSSSRSTGYNNN